MTTCTCSLRVTRTLAPVVEGAAPTWRPLWPRMTTAPDLRTPSGCHPHSRLPASTVANSVADLYP